MPIWPTIRWAQDGWRITSITCGSPPWIGALTSAAQTRHPAELNVSYIELLVPFGWPVGEYIVRVRAAAAEDAPPERRFLEFGIHPHGRAKS